MLHIINRWLGLSPRNGGSQRPSFKIKYNPALSQCRNTKDLHAGSGTHNPPHWHAKGPRCWWRGQ
jgi:hypothetical protein